MLLITYGPPALLEQAFFATLYQVGKDRSDTQRIGKLEQESQLLLWESDRQYVASTSHHIDSVESCREPGCPTYQLLWTHPKHTPHNVLCQHYHHEGGNNTKALGYLLLI